MIVRIAIATISLGSAFCLGHFFPQATTLAEPTRSAMPAPPAPPQATSSPISDITTARGILDAAAGLVEIPPGVHERLRFGDWANRDPRAAFEAAVGRKDQQLASTVITSIAESDPHLALELAGENETRMMNGFYDEIFRAWPEDRLAEGAEALLALNQKVRAERDTAFEQGLGDFESSRINRNRVRLAMGAAKGLGERWPVDDNANLLRWTSLLLVGTGYDSTFLVPLMGERQVNDVDFISSIGDPEAQAIAATYIADLGDTDLALRAIRALPPDQQARPVFALAQHIAQTDKAGALRFLRENYSAVASKEDPSSFDSKIEFGMLLFNEWSDFDLDREELAALPLPLRTFIGDEPAVAERAEALRDFPDGEKARTYADETLREWTQEDPTAASAWLTTLAPGAIRDHSIASFVREISSSDPKSAIAWAAEISDQAMRERFLRIALRRWKATDEQAANNAIPNFGLSPMAVESLLRE